MRSFSLLALLWRLRLGARSISWLGLSSLLVFAACAAGYGLVLRPQQRQIDQAQNALRWQDSLAKAPATAGAGPAQQLAAFYRGFPGPERVPALMARVYGAAAQQGLVLEQGDYQLLPVDKLKLNRTVMVFPLKGGYPQIRQFVAQALADVPSLALDGIRFKRQKISDTVLEAELGFTLYWGVE